MRTSDKCFDRETGKPVPASQLKTYRQALAQYHLSPETKFLNARYLDRGPTRRRHVQAISIDHIGKEANRWEEQYYLGLDLDMQIKYGVDEINSAEIRDIVQASELSSRQLAEAVDISRNDISAFRRGKTALSQHQLQRLLAAINFRN
jgi:predicted XRE-type DNA-binding protein